MRNIHDLNLDLQSLKLIISYDPATGEFRWIRNRRSVKAGSVCGWIDSRGYRVIQLGNKNHKAHRLAWFLTYGEYPTKSIDHINGKPSDNRITNLRLATHTQNCQNTRRNTRNKTGLKGVYFCKRTQLFGSVIVVSGKKKFLGRYNSAELAHQAYCNAAKKNFGEFANFG